jgi:3-deoxy-D-manno-octulosonic-acid transferase
MALPQALYRTALRALRALSPPMMRGGGKFARGLRGTRDAHGRLAAWGRASDSAAPDAPPVVWVHASSVGESLQARAVIDVLRRRTPGLRVVFTFFSPSAERVCEDFPADVCSYLPWDLPRVIGPVLDAVMPSVIVFTQREVWPTLADEAGARGVPTVLVAGTMPEGAGRLSWPGRLLLGAAFRSLRAVAAVSGEDGERFGLLGVRSDRVTVTGDPGIDAVRDRVAGIDRNLSYMRFFSDEGGPILVAGSIWPSDEEVLLPAAARVRESVPGMRMVLAPHEPEGYDFTGLGRRLAADGWTPALLGEIERACDAECAHEVEGAEESLKGGAVQGADVILVDRVGVLADLYTLASVAYVGGGFHKRGLHSVLEPAAAALPVLIGPRYGDSVHATRLLAVGAVRSVADAGALANALEEWLEAPKKNEAPGQRAMDYIESYRGSAEDTADLITQFLPRQDRWGTLSKGGI